MDEDKPAAHWVYSKAMAEARIRFELAFEKLEGMTGGEKAKVQWGHAGSAEWLLNLTKQMCEHLGVDEDDVEEGYGE